MMRRPGRGVNLRTVREVVQLLVRDRRQQRRARSDPRGQTLRESDLLSFRQRRRSQSAHRADSLASASVDRCAGRGRAAPRHRQDAHSAGGAAQARRARSPGAIDDGIAHRLRRGDSDRRRRSRAARADRGARAPSRRGRQRLSRSRAGRDPACAQPDRVGGRYLRGDYRRPVVSGSGNARTGLPDPREAGRHQAQHVNRQGVCQRHQLLPDRLGRAHRPRRGRRGHPHHYWRTAAPDHRARQRFQRSAAGGSRHERP